jgi:hypothetical protein
VEIYNDQIIDLLSNYDSSQVQNRALQIMECKNGIKVEHLSHHMFDSLELAEDMLHHGLYNRKVFETTKNTQSSRSHAILQL